jgi:isoleucyl-tRNA synthetase
VTRLLVEWRPDAAARELEEFVETLTNWYVRRSRRRFWKSEGDADKQGAYLTLYSVLTALTRLLAPFMPFLAEEMYQNLVARLDGDAPPSVHLADWPEADESKIDEELSSATRLAMRLASLGRSARASSRLKVRQPLAELVVDLPADVDRSHLERIDAQLKDELNVKSLREAREIGGLMRYVVKPNLPALGRKYGPRLPEIRAQLERADATSVAGLAAAGETVTLGEFELEPDELLIEQIAPEGYAVASEAGYSVGVNLEVTPELRAEGTAREAVHLIQNLRRDAGFEISDRIKTHIQATVEVREALQAHADYLREETLSVELTFGPPPAGAAIAEHDVDGAQVTLGVVKA